MKQIMFRSLLICFSIVALIAGSTSAQNSGKNEIQLKTRLVVLDVIVREKRTGAPVSDLARADFEVLDEGKRRGVSHFSIGEKRQPLAVVLLLDL